MGQCEDCIHSKEKEMITGTVPAICRDYKDEIMVVMMHSPHLIDEVECKNYMSRIESKGW